MTTMTITDTKSTAIIIIIIITIISSSSSVGSMDIWVLGAELRADLRSREVLGAVFRGWLCEVQRRRQFLRRRFRRISRRLLRLFLRQWWDIIAFRRVLQHCWSKHVAALRAWRLQQLQLQP